MPGRPDVRCGPAAIGAVLAALSLAVPVGAQCEVARLVASDAAALDFFGSAIAVREQTVFVGASGGDGNEINTGSVYVFTAEGAEWVERDELFAHDGARSDQFGSSLAVADDLLVVGAPGDDDLANGAGSAYLFRQDGTIWREDAKLLAPDGAERIFFGTSVAIDGEIVLVGAPGNDGGGQDAGAAYLFRHGGGRWTLEATLRADEPEPGARFGQSVAIAGELALIGAPSSDGVAGRVHAFRRLSSVWVETQVLTDGVPDGEFGYAVAMEDRVALVGAPEVGEEEEEEDGAAYLFDFEGETWTLAEKLLASDRAADQEYGRAVGLGESLGVVGAPWAEPDGAGYFVRTEGADTGDDVARVVGAERSRLFGEAVAISGDFAIIGDRASDDAGNSSGAAYVYAIDAPDCNGNGRGDCLDIAYGDSADCNGDGIPDECVEDGTGPIAVERRTIHVPGDAATIQAAVDLADDGDEIVLANGIYRGAGNRDIDFDGKRIVLRSEDCDPDRCVIDCETEGRGFLLASGEPQGTVVAGLTVLNARTSYDGAGVLCSHSTPVFTDCVFRGCSALYGSGGAIASDDASPTFRRCAFDANEAPNSSGGGIFARGDGVLTVTRCSFTGNSSRWWAGGAMTLFAGVEATIQDSTFDANLCATGGGAIYIDTERVLIARSRFAGNGSRLAWGGAILAFQTDLRVVECVFERNASGDAGGGIATLESDAEIVDSTFEANTTVNEGAGVWVLESGGSFDGCVFDGNVSAGDGGGLFARGSSPVVATCVFRRNAAAAGGGIMGVDDPVGPVVSASRFCANDPDHLAGTYRDDGGNEFFDDACESECPADVDGSGAVDTVDLILVLAAWGACDTCPADIDRNGVVDVRELLLVLAAWGPCPE